MFSGLITIARAEVHLAIRRGLLALAGTALMLGAAGLGLAAAVIETSTHMGIAAALGLWGGVVFLIAVGVLLLATRRRHVVHPAATGAALGSDAGAGPVPVSGQAGAVQDAYRLGEQFGSTLSPLMLVGGLLALGIVSGRRRR